MFKVIDMCGRVYDAYGAFVDDDGIIQFILCNGIGEFFKTNEIEGFYRLYNERT